MKIADLDFEVLVEIAEKTIKTAKYMKSFQCNNPRTCGHGAICNSCWSRNWAEDFLKSLVKYAK